MTFERRSWACARRAAFSSSVKARDMRPRAASFKECWRFSFALMKSPCSPRIRSRKPVSSLIDFGDASSFRRAVWYSLMAASRCRPP